MSLYDTPAAAFRVGYRLKEHDDRPDARSCVAIAAAKARY
jgi:hypothetical protein